MALELGRVKRNESAQKVYDWYIYIIKEKTPDSEYTCIALCDGSTPENIDTVLGEFEGTILEARDYCKECLEEFDKDLQIKEARKVMHKKLKEFNDMWGAEV
jgi:hypothetical protein